MCSTEQKMHNVRQEMESSVRQHVPDPGARQLGLHDIPGHPGRAASGLPGLLYTGDRTAERYDGDLVYLYERERHARDAILFRACRRGFPGPYRHP